MSTSRDPAPPARPGRAPRALLPHLTKFVSSRTPAASMSSNPWSVPDPAARESVRRCSAHFFLKSLALLPGFETLPLPSPSPRTGTLLSPAVWGLAQGPSSSCATRSPGSPVRPQGSANLTTQTRPWLRSPSSPVQLPAGVLPLDVLWGLETLSGMEMITPPTSRTFWLLLPCPLRSSTSLSTPRSLSWGARRLCSRGPARRARISPVTPAGPPVPSSGLSLASAGVAPHVLLCLADPSAAVPSCRDPARDP